MINISSPEADEYISDEFMEALLNFVQEAFPRHLRLGSLC